VPPHGMDDEEKAPQTSMEALLAIMARLRDPVRGCSWDVQQDFASIAPYTIEEAYEVADAIERKDMAALKDELGDLLLQVVFHAQMASEAGAFDFDQVAQSIVDKMVRRHPHVFGDAPSAGWESIKAAERQSSGNHGALAGVARSLPALKRAEKLQKRAARVGFDWPDASGPRAKLDEELAELASAPDHEARVEEFGDLLFTMVNLARHMNIDAEDALAKANSKFIRRFEGMETLAGDDFASRPAEEKENLWMRVKQGEADRQDDPDRS